MNKILFVFLFVGSFVFAQEGSVSATIGGGITQGTSKYVSDFAFAADVNYLFNIYDDLQLGPSLGLMYFGGKEEEGVQYDSMMFLPIGASVRFQAYDDVFFVGTDLGYGIALSEGSTGGVYYKPFVGYNINEELKVSLSYAVVKAESSTGYIGLHLSYDFGGGGSYAMGGRSF